MFQPGHAGHSLGQVSFVAGHENGEGREGKVGRHDTVYGAEGLTVRDDKTWLLAQGGQGSRQFVILRHNGCGAGVEEVPNGLLFRQDQASFGSRLVDGDDQDREVSRGNEVRAKREGRLLSGTRRAKVSFKSAMFVPVALLTMR